MIEIDFEKLRKKHWHIVYELKKLCYVNDFYQRLIAPEYLDKYIKEMTNQLFEKNRFQETQSTADNVLEKK
jgi:hypothetical protein